MTSKFGNLFPLDVPEPAGSHRKILCRCDCGRESMVEIRKLVKGHTKSCGRCNQITSSEMAQRKFGSLKIEIPVDLLPGSNKKITWLCDCGRKHEATPNSVLGGHTTSCGRCDNFSALEMSFRKFGTLKMKFPSEVSPGSPKIVDWICDCGKEVKSHVKSVVRGLRKSCSRCDEIPAEELAVTTFGRLKIKTPIPLTRSSSKKVVWLCSCGNETNPLAHHVISGHTKSCGKCFDMILKEFETTIEHLRGLRTPIDPSDVKSRFVKPLETVKKVSEPFKAECPMCLQVYLPRWSDIRLGKSLTCGCSTNRVSSGQRDVYEYIKSLGKSPKIEGEIGSMKYDVIVEDTKLAVEFQGLLWHTRVDSKKRDLAKYKNALENGWDYFAVYEDEWMNRRSVIESILKNKLNVRTNCLNLRPSQCEIKRIPYEDSSSFYESYHYIGKTKSHATYGVFYGDVLVACTSFGKPTRQSKHSWELTRMASHPDYRVHGIWSKVMSRFILEFNPDSIVSFSDNRLFSGKVYEKIGYQFDGDVDPDYYWVKGKKRYHKSSLRKTTPLKTEIEEREGDGFKRVYDLGKKRWVWHKPA